MAPEIRSILCPTDLGPQSEHILRYVQSLARTHNASVVLVHAVEPLPPNAKNFVDTILPEGTATKLREEGVVRLREKLEALVGSLSAEAEVTEIRLLEGASAPAILGAAREVGADVIVMGTHGYSALEEIVLGSVAHKVIHKSTIPVMLIPFRAVEG